MGSTLLSPGTGRREQPVKSADSCQTHSSVSCSGAHTQTDRSLPSCSINTGITAIWLKELILLPP